MKIKISSKVIKLIYMFYIMSMCLSHRFLVMYNVNMIVTGFPIHSYYKSSNRMDLFNIYSIYGSHFLETKRK